MNYLSRNLRHIASACIALAIGMAGVNAFAQERRSERGFCSNENWSSDGRSSASDVREIPLSATGSLSVDSNQNGGISVMGEERGNVLVRACIQAWGSSEAEAKALAAAIRINTSGTIKADNPSGDKNWSVSYQILVPRSTDLNLTAHNGGIHIRGVNGTAEFETQNGGVHLSDVSGSVKGRTTNGGVHVELTGTSWRGSGLDVTTTNGGVHVSMPRNYAAHVETGTVNGGFKSNIPGLAVEDKEGYGHRAKRVSADINGGGAPIRIVTTNGGVKIGSSED